MRAKAFTYEARPVAQRIRKLRFDLDLTQRDLGVPGAGYAYISRIEAGKRRPSIEVLIALAERLKTTALFLLTGDHNERCPVCQRGPLSRS